MATARSAPILYMTDLSPPVRSVLMVARVLGIPLRKKDVNLSAGEHRTKEYLKKNPQGTVPLLEDEGHFVWDSHAISGYLVQAYAKDDSLYPKDSKMRSTVDQRLHFDTGILYPEFRNIVYPIILDGQRAMTKEKINRVEVAYGMLDTILKNGRTKWLAGDAVTLADLCSVSTVSTLELFVPPMGKFPHMEEWLLSCKVNIPGYQEANQRGLERLVKLIKTLLTRL